MPLTAAERFEHVGRMLDHGITNISPLIENDFVDFPQFMRFLVLFAKDYRVNGTHGTQADRTEAMRAAMRQLYQAVTGNDPDVFDHHFRHHWIEDVAGDGEANEYS